MGKWKVALECGHYLRDLTQPQLVDYVNRGSALCVECVEVKALTDRMRCGGKNVGQSRKQFLRASARPPFVRGYSDGLNIRWLFPGATEQNQWWCRFCDGNQPSDRWRIGRAPNLAATLTEWEQHLASPLHQAHATSRSDARLVADSILDELRSSSGE